MAAAVAAARVAAAELTAFATEVAGCTKCRLSEGRTQVVFGAGNPHADLMFVGEAPGFHEDQQGKPFVGQAGKLLDKLLAGIGLERERRLHRERPQVPPARATATPNRTRSRRARATCSARSR